MREHSRDKGRLEDIRQYALNVEQILDGVTFDEFVQDIRIYYSVMKNVEVIGEATNMLTKDFKEKHPELPWRQIVKMRNVLVHGYAQVSDADLWDTAYNDIQPLRMQIEHYLAEIDWNAWNNAENTFSEITLIIDYIILVIDYIASYLEKFLIQNIGNRLHDNGNQLSR